MQTELAENKYVAGCQAGVGGRKRWQRESRKNKVNIKKVLSGLVIYLYHLYLYLKKALSGLKK